MVGFPIVMVKCVSNFILVQTSYQRNLIMKKEISQLLSDTYKTFPVDDTDDKKDDFWAELSDIEKYDINEKYLRIIGNPKYDYLVCWEPGRFNVDELVTDFDTLYDVDHSWWEFQKNSIWKYIEEMKQMMEKNPNHMTPEKVADSINSFNETYENGYKIYMSGDWYRLIDGSTFIYSQFISASWYIFFEIENYLEQLQQTNIPYKFNDCDDFLSSFNQDDPEKIYNACGREHELVGCLDKVKDYKNKKMIQVIDTVISKHSKNLSGKTFRVDKGYDKNLKFEPFTNFIFFDEKTLKKIKTKKFLKTFKQNQVEFTEFEKLIDEVKKIVKVDFEKIYNDNRLQFQK